MKKIIGWFFVFGGVAIILYSIFLAYNVFMAKTAVPPIFAVSLKEGELAPKTAPKDLTPEAIQEQMGTMLFEQIQQFLPADFLPKLFNLFAFSMFTGILIWAGGQISNVGIKLLKG